jgi:hypothetical protein
LVVVQRPQHGLEFHPCQQQDKCKICEVSAVYEASPRSGPMSRCVGFEKQVSHEYQGPQPLFSKRCSLPDVISICVATRSGPPPHLAKLGRSSPAHPLNLAVGNTSPFESCRWQHFALCLFWAEKRCHCICCIYVLHMVSSRSYHLDCVTNPILAHARVCAHEMVSNLQGCKFVVWCKFQ